jgi:hypothetical protein
VSVEHGVSTTEALPVFADDRVTPGTDLVPAPEAPRDPKAKAPKAPKPPKKKQARTTRVVLRRVEPWSVLKLSIIYYLALFLIILVAGALLWAGASTIGVIENVESFMVDIGFDDFRFVPSKLLGGMALAGLVLVVAGTVANVIMCALFNLMGDVTGGLKLTLQEDAGPLPRAERRRGRPAPAHAAEPGEPTV